VDGGRASPVAPTTSLLPTVHHHRTTLPAATMSVLRDIQVSLGLQQPGASQLDRARDDTGGRGTSAVDRIKQRLGLQEKSEFQELQESMCPKLTYEQVNASTRVHRCAHGTACGGRQLMCGSFPATLPDSACGASGSASSLAWP